jgi:two-component system osmolarity sensor histidine kinase EnvZ
MKLLKRILPRSLFGRSLIIIITPLILLQGMVTLIFYERHWDSVSRRLALGLAGELAAVVQIREDAPSSEIERQLLADVERHMYLDINFVPDAALPDDVPRTTDRMLDRVLTSALGERLHYPYQVDTRSYERRVEIKIQLEDGVLEVLASRKRLTSSTTYIFVMWMVGTSILLIGLAVIFLRNQMKPISRLAKAAEAFGKGRPSAHLKPEGAREIRQAAVAFLDMQERIKRQIQQRTEMLAGVSHDLRTPLTRMRLQLAMMAPDGETESLGNDLTEMEKMIDEYLAFARGDSPETTREVKLSELLRDVVEDATRKGNHVELEADAEVQMQVRPNAFKRCLTNLVENALHHGEAVKISARLSGEAIEIAVEDDGPGIAKEDREAVFKPFFRLDESRNPATGGAGLGLSIARDVARAHGGDVTLSESAMGGLRALLRLPV